MSRRGEAGTAIAWFALGAAIAVAAWRMDRLRHLDVNPWSVPGLTPGAIGVLMMLFAAVLGWRALRAPPDAAPGAAAVEPRAEQGVQAGSPAGAPMHLPAAAPAMGETRRTLVAGALCLLFAGATLGRGVPFVVEGALFVFAFTAVFSWRAWRDEGRVGRGLARTAVVAVLAAVLISWLFETVFLVRLP